MKIEALVAKLTPPDQNEKVIAFLKKAPPGEVFTTDELVIAANVTTTAIKKRKDPRLFKYRVKAGNTFYYGSPEALLNFRKALGGAK